MKKYLKGIIVTLIILTLLILISIMFSTYRANKYKISVVNQTKYQQNDIQSIFVEHRDESIYIMLHDDQNDDCVYLDQVLLKQISYENNGLLFEDIHKISVSETSKTFNIQILKNTYHIETIPAIIKLNQDSEGYINEDNFQWSGNLETDTKLLNEFLIRNGFITSSEH